MFVFEEEDFEAGELLPFKVSEERGFGRWFDGNELLEVNGECYTEECKVSDGFLLVAIFRSSDGRISLRKKLKMEKTRRIRTLKVLLSTSLPDLFNLRGREKGRKIQ